MKANLRTLSLGIAALIMSAPLAQADDGMYLGVVGTLTKTKIDTTGMTSGTKTEGGTGGMVFLGIPLSTPGNGESIYAEVGYLSAGIGKVNGAFPPYGTVDYKQSLTGLTAAVVARGRTGLFAKIGMASVTEKEEFNYVTLGGSASIDTKSTVPMYSIGWDFMGDTVGVRLEVGRLSKIKDSINDTWDVDFYNVGLLLNL